MTGSRCAVPRIGASAEELCHLAGSPASNDTVKLWLCLVGGIRRPPGLWRGGGQWRTHLGSTIFGVAAVGETRASAEGSGEDRDCPFCRIVDGADAGAQVVGEDDAWIAFFPLHPATLGHTLVIPREHVSDLWKADVAVVSDLSVACVSVGRALDHVLAPDGMNLISSAGEAAEQSVYHLHLHIVPRWINDDMEPIWPSDSETKTTADPTLVRAVRQALSTSPGSDS